MEQKNTKSQQAHQSILNNLGNRGVQSIINDPTPFPDYVYRPNPDAFIYEVLGEQKGSSQNLGQTSIGTLSPHQEVTGQNIREDKSKLFNPTSTDERRTLQVCRDGIEKVGAMQIGEEKGHQFVKGGKKRRPL